MTSAGTFKLAAGVVNLTSTAVVPLGSSFNFQGVGGSDLVITNPANFDTGWTLPISNFASTDVISLTGDMFTPGTIDSSHYDAAAHTLTVPTALGNYVFTNFSAAPGAAGNSYLIGAHSVEMICFAEGTRIATEDGSRPVQSLQPGDRVLTLHNGPRAVRWIGRRRGVAGRYANPAAVWPVRIAAGAFGDGLPSRELRVSPEHALFVDGKLAPARMLINGTSVAQEPVETFAYFHVELDSHDIIFAEGLPAESWLDAGNRSMFDNAGVVMLHHRHEGAAAAAWAGAACAPLLDSGPELDAIRERLAARAAELGFGAVAEQEVWLGSPGTHDIALSPHTEVLRLTSPRRLLAGEGRTLGACVAAITIDGAALALDDTRLGLGFHVVEGRENAVFRWTDGAALVHVGRSDRPRIISVRIAAVAGRAQAA
jgi:hypothetical protein